MWWFWKLEYFTSKFRTPSRGYGKWLLWGLWSPSRIIEISRTRDKRNQPHEERLEIVNLGEDGEEKHVKIGTSLTKDMQERLYSFLREFNDVFAWSYQDMPWLDPDIVQHKLPLKPKCSPIKQKLRR